MRTPKDSGRRAGTRTNGIRVAPSILAADFSRLADEVTSVADVLVAGTAVFGAPEPCAAICRLRWTGGATEKEAG